MKKIIIIAMFLPVISFSQNNKHNFYGVDLDLDWYTLTNLQALSFHSALETNKEAQYVITEFKNSHNKIDSALLNIGFS